MLLGLANVWLSRAEAWQLRQYWPKPMNGSGLEATGGKSTCQPLFTSGQPYQPQNQPSLAALLSRIMTAAPCSIGLSLSRSGTRQAAAGVEFYISLTMMAPSGTGGGLGFVWPGARYFFS